MSDGVWLWLLVTDNDLSDAKPAAGDLYAIARPRVNDFPPPVAAARTLDWWSMPDCAELASSLDDTALGFDSIDAVFDSHLDYRADNFGDAGWVPDGSGVARYCEIRATSTDRPDDWTRILVRFVAGGAVEFQTVMESEDARTVEVAGAESAVVVHDNDRLDGGGDLLVVTDGVNVMTILGSTQTGSPPESFAGLAAALLAQLPVR